MLKKNVEIQDYKAIDDEIIEILASDESVDRDNDIIKVDGWQTDNWLKNGSLLYGHDPSSPFNVVGAPVSVEKRGKKLYVQARLAKQGTSPTHDAIRSLIEQKILKGVSVGFKSSEYENNEYGGRTFKSAELLELSIVPVPANANAKLLLKSFDQAVQDVLIQETKWVTEDQVKEIVKNYLNDKDNIEPIQEETKAVEPEKTWLEKVTSHYNKLGEK